MENVPSWCREGEKVVAIKPFSASEGSISIAEGTRLTIRSYEYCNHHKTIGLRFNEIHNAFVLTFQGFAERGYDISSFKPLITKTMEQDLEMFVPLLKTVREEELV